MLKKIVIGVLALTVIGTGAAVVIYQQAAGKDMVEVVGPIDEQVVGQNAVAGQSNGWMGQQGQQGQPQTEAVSEPASDVGEAWQATGMVSKVDDFGLTLAQDDGSEVYVELGPPDFWQAQGIELVEGDMVIVDGFASDGLYHARTVTVSSGAQITVRNEFGQPLWSGGVSNGQGQNGNQTGSQDGEHVPDPQVSADEWVTIDGEIVAVARNSITVLTTTGETLVISLGQPRFAEDQGIVFAVEQHVTITGFYQNAQFQAGDILIEETGQRLMLRDPNGRPLWAGPGGNGNDNGAGGSNGNGGNNAP